MSSRYTIVERMRIGSVSRNEMPKRKSYHGSSQMLIKFDISPASKTSTLMLVNTSVKSTITGASHLYRTYKSVRPLAVLKNLSPQIMGGIDGTLDYKPPVVKRDKLCNKRTVMSLYTVCFTYC